MQSHAKLLWCPVDIPKFPYSDFNPSLEVKEFFAWKYKKLIRSKRGSSTISEINPIVCKEYPDLIDWINLFPFKTIRKINLHTQIKECQSHLDFGYQQVIKKGYDKKLIQSSLKKYSDYAIYGTEEIYNADIKHWNESVGLNK